MTNPLKGEVEIELSGQTYKCSNDFDDKKIKQILAKAGIIRSSTVVAQLLADTLNDPESEEEEGDSSKKLQETQE